MPVKLQDPENNYGEYSALHRAAEAYMIALRKARTGGISVFSESDFESAFYAELAPFSATRDECEVIKKLIEENHLLAELAASAIMASDEDESPAVPQADGAGI